jgi:hypothetical protein
MEPVEECASIVFLIAVAPPSFLLHIDAPPPPPMSPRIVGERFGNGSMSGETIFLSRMKRPGSEGFGPGCNPRGV